MAVRAPDTPRALCTKVLRSPCDLLWAGEEPNLLVSRDGSECVACEDGLKPNEKQTNCTEDGH